MRVEEFIKTKIPVVEIFQSVSGEGISAGSIVTFVRVAGCNLRCSYCDTRYSYDENSADNEMLTPEEVYEKVSELNCLDVLCTGGEPLETDKEKRYLPLYLASKGLRVRIETNGSCPVYSDEEIENFCGNKDIELYYVLDAKSPSSLESDEMIYEENYKGLKSGDELKFVVGNDEDIKHSLEIIEKYHEIFSLNDVVINFSPIYGKITAEYLVEMLKANQKIFTKYKLKVRLSLQLHKIIWNPELRGV